MIRVSRPFTKGVFAVVCGLVVGGCSDQGPAVIEPGLASLSAKTTAVSVKATDPGFGDQGQIHETVTITGSGFKDGATAAWLRNGAVDQKITVVSTQFVNSTTLVAVIDIAADAPLDFRDVQVYNRDRTQGIGAAVFEVTQAHIISGALVARDVNDNGEVTGSLSNGGTFYYNILTGLFQTVSAAAGTGYEISPRGDAIAGEGLGSGQPVLYRRTGQIGTAWTVTQLPIDPNAVSGVADAMVTDPGTGEVTMLGGIETFSGGGKCIVGNAVIWTVQASTGTWQRTVLPKNGACQSELRPRGLSANGTAVGRVDGVAAVWTPNGSGGYTLTLLDGAYADGIDGSASMIVGESSSRRTASVAVYWLASGAGWGNAIPFTGSCIASRDVADVSRRVTLNNCSFGGNSVTYAAYMDPPYSSLTKLGGVGGHNDDFVSGISPSGRYMVGYGFTSGSAKVGVYWSP